MRALLQRVTRASVRIHGVETGRIERGLVVLLGVSSQDAESDAAYLAERIAHLRIFQDDDGKTNLSLLEVRGSVLAISQFTLYADCTRGRRPGFSYAGRPEIAEPLYHRFMELLRSFGVMVAEGQFGADMLVEIHNDGPFTIMLDSDEKRRED